MAKVFMHASGEESGLWGGRMASDRLLFRPTRAGGSSRSKPSRKDEMELDIGPEEFERLSLAVGERLAALTDMPLDRAIEIAGSVCGCIRGGDEDGMLTFRDEDEKPVVRLPYEHFADLLEDEEEEEEE